MKAVRLLEYGGQLVFDDVPTPTIARDEVLVKVTSTAVNHVDLVKASGTARQVPKEFMNYCSVTFRKFLEKVTLRSAAPPSTNSTRMTACCMSPQVPSSAAKRWINLQVT